MNMEQPWSAVPEGMDDTEWKLRLELAGLYRVVHHLG